MAVGGGSKKSLMKWQWKHICSRPLDRFDNVANRFRRLSGTNNFRNQVSLTPTKPNLAQPKPDAAKGFIEHQRLFCTCFPLIFEFVPSTTVQRSQLIGKSMCFQNWTSTMTRASIESLQILILHLYIFYPAFLYMFNN